MDNKKFEQLIDLIINENEEQARALFHDIVVEKSREIYESMMDEEMDEGMGGQVGDLLDEINVEEELGRLGKEIAKLDKDIGRARTNLDNPSFVSRAPAQVLSQEKERLEKFTDIRTNLLNQFDRLNARKNNSAQPISSGNA